MRFISVALFVLNTISVCSELVVAVDEEEESFSWLSSNSKSAFVVAVLPDAGTDADDDDEDDVVRLFCIRGLD